MIALYENQISRENFVMSDKIEIIPYESYPFPGRSRCRARRTAVRLRYRGHFGDDADGQADVCVERMGDGADGRECAVGDGSWRIDVRLDRRASWPPRRASHRRVAVPDFGRGLRGRMGLVVAGLVSCDRRTRRGRGLGDVSDVYRGNLACAAARAAGAGVPAQYRARDSGGLPVER